MRFPTGFYGLKILFLYGKRNSGFGEAEFQEFKFSGSSFSGKTHL